MTTWMPPMTGAVVHAGCDIVVRFGPVITVADGTPVPPGKFVHW